MDSKESRPASEASRSSRRAAPRAGRAARGDDTGAPDTTSASARPPSTRAAAEEQAWAAFGEFLRTQRRLAQLSLRQLAELTHVSNPYLSQIERGLYRPSAAVLKSIAGALGIAPQAVFTRAGLLEEEPEGARRPSVEEAIALATELTTEQKQALVAVYRSLVGAGAH